MFNEPFEGVGHPGAYARLGGLDGGRLLWRRALERLDDVVPVARPLRMLSVQRLFFGLGVRSQLCATHDGYGREMPKWKAEHESPGKGCKERCVVHSRLLELPIWGQVLSLICAGHLGTFQLLSNTNVTSATTLVVYILCTSSTGTGFQLSRRR